MTYAAINPFLYRSSPLSPSPLLPTSFFLSAPSAFSSPPYSLLSSSSSTSPGFLPPFPSSLFLLLLLPILLSYFVFPSSPFILYPPPTPSNRPLPFPPAPQPCLPPSPPPCNYHPPHAAYIKRKRLTTSIHSQDRPQAGTDSPVASLVCEDSAAFNPKKTRVK